MARLQKTEAAHHLAAFEKYYALGEKRTYRQVAAELGVSEATVLLWGRSFQWRSRVRAREIEVARRIAEKTLTNVTDTRIKRRKIVELALIKYAKALSEDRVRYQAGDLDRLLRLEGYLDELEGSRGMSEVPSAEEIAAFLHSIDSATLMKVRQICWREMLKLYPELVAAGAPETAPSLPFRVQGTPFEAVASILRVCGL